MRIPFIFRELRASGRQAMVLMSCVALAVASLTVVDSFHSDVVRLLRGDARALHGGDLLIESNYPFSAAMERAVATLAAKGAKVCRQWHLYSLLRHDDHSVFSQLNIVEPNYPLYGQVELQSARPLAEALKPGTIIVAPELLPRLGLKIGDFVQAGEVRLQVVDCLMRESSRPIEIFRLGPPVLAHAADLAAMNLVREGSRTQYKIATALPQGPPAAEDEAKSLRAISQNGAERVETAATARSGVKRFFDNLLFFLSLTALATLLLSGIGVHSSATALVRERQTAIAICKAMGADSAFLFRRYLALTALVATGGVLAGILLAALFKPLFPLLFPGVFPAEHITALNLAAAANASALGFTAALLFALGPLTSLKNVRPMLLLRRETASGLAARAGQALIRAAVAAPVAILLVFLVVRHMEDTRTGLYFLGGLAALTFVAFILTSLALTLARRLDISPLIPRLALRGLSRPGNASVAVITTLATALALLLTMFLVRKNLEDNYITSFPPDAPNVFVLNIQKDEGERFQQLAAVPCRLYLVIRGRLKAINGKPVLAERDGKPAIDTLTREFSLTYQESLLPDEHLVIGKSLFKKDADGKLPLQVSVLDTVRDMGNMKLGDVLTFSIQGVPLEAEITSIRVRNHAGLSPFFYFVLPPKYLEKAPQNAFAAIRMPPGQVAALQNLLAAKMPHLTVLDLGPLTAEIGRVAGKFVRLVNFFAALSIIAGLFILWGSLLASRLPRLAEAVYYRVMGAGRGFIFLIFLVENLALGLAAALVAIVIAQPAAWLLCRHGLDLSYQPCWLASLALAATATLLTGIAALPGQCGTTRSSLATSLKEQWQE
ncbi:MAG: hypothetical protein LBH14_01490 [Desulfobulbaceae bacterium]|jgi:putative ABC transport system permease protein|nr:hypothetical protein [Desulfobulbaceae bacterium]